MSELHGFIAPLTPTGKSALVPNMPWYYSGTLLTVEYLTDPANVRALLPDDIELADDLLGKLARFLLQLSREWHGTVGLIVSELSILCRFDHVGERLRIVDHVGQ